ncbi:MAG: DegT/DnrJ/EryC1/StrS family aminotransferase [Bacteroidaceae bacterium]
MCGTQPTGEEEKVLYLDLKKISDLFEPTLSEEVTRVVKSGWYLLDKENERFARLYADYCGAAYCVPTGNGLDALANILRAYKHLLGWQDGDEVIVPANTFIATILAVTHTGLKPVLCEPSLTNYLMDIHQAEQLITPRTRAIIPVHLYGRLCDMVVLRDMADRYGLKVIDDAAQAHGASLNGMRVGSLAHATAFSFYPGKNLGALGDAGCVTTDDGELAKIVQAMGNYGSEVKYVHQLKGINSRMDEIQAAVLSLKLQRLDKDNDRRRMIARMYDEGIQNPLVALPSVASDPLSNVYHIYPLRCPARDTLQNFLSAHGIQTQIHYPNAPHKQLAYAEWAGQKYRISERIHAEELSLPISPVLTDGEVQRVIDAVNAFNVEL